MQRKRLATGKVVGAWSYESPNYAGITVGVKNSNGDLQPVIHAESVRCADGLVDRVVILKAELRKLGFVIVEDEETKQEPVKGSIDGILISHSADDVSFWEGFSLSEEDEEAIWSILKKYDTQGCSVRGTRKEVVEEIKK